MTNDYMVFNDKHKDEPIIQWDHASWLLRFHTRSVNPHHYRGLRIEVFSSSTQIIQAGKYKSASGSIVHLDQDAILRAHKNTQFYPCTQELNIPQTDVSHETQFYTLEADCLETNRILQLSNYNPAVLNMANAFNPGGGVASGSGAQEENLFRRSTAFTSLYQYVDYASQYDVERNTEFSYPIPEDSGGIYSPDLIVFRSSEKTGYYLLESPCPLHMITVAAISHPKLESIDEKMRIAQNMIPPTKEKIRTILRIGKLNGHDALVLSAWGCGAFANPPEHIAELFQEVFCEQEFSNAFKIVVFAIIDDHNAYKKHNLQGNVSPFQIVFNK